MGICASKELIGTTSACAENANAPNLPKRCHQNYLRVRGEYTPSPPCRGTAGELPPRARRILPPKTTRDSSTGTTSACAENTAKMQDTTGRPWNYLRVRGEYGEPHMPFDETRELPPRARRIRASRNNMKHITRTTSACAENTNLLVCARSPGKNYLRVRGEYLRSHQAFEANLELPPRARRIRTAQMGFLRAHGTTSACAENTQTPSDSTANPGNYLRVRGEYNVAPVALILPQELPPRARRIHPC